MQRNPRTPTGVRVRHARSCTTKVSDRCNCTPAYEAAVYSPRDGKKIRKTFSTLAAARAWRDEAATAVRQKKLRAPVSTTLNEAAAAWLEGAEQGTIRTRSGDQYKPGVVRGYELLLRARVLPRFGTAKLGSLDRNDVQDFADELVAEGLDPSTVRNILMPLRVVYRRALQRGEVSVNPVTGLVLPAVRGRRDRIATASEAAALIDALPEKDRALWAVVFYAGLRRGELMALDIASVNLDLGIEVSRSFDTKTSTYTSPKSRSGTRRVPVPAVLRSHLAAHLLRLGRSEGLLFGPDGQTPFAYQRTIARARTAWAEAGLDAIGLHEARHTFASLMIAAGVNVKAISSYMGHASITITLDRYGHLMPGNEQEAAGLLDTYLAAQA
jgi:integrase